MAVQLFDNSLAGQTAANAVPAPKNMLFTGAGFEVRTGADYVAPANLVPVEVSAFQARAALSNAGLLPAVTAFMTAPTTAQVDALAWEYSTSFQRNSPTLNRAAAALGMSQAQLDALFIAAAQIVA